ncbi:MAG TPA: STAS domain-containing protein [Opitutaceae bacterium]|jgi:anti-anti-sigma regulatory factor|nr:STAS domain-containing protein [Opitutaceae bacterium]
MSDLAVKPVFLVDAYSDPVLVRIEGRANFQNSVCLRDFVNETVGEGRRHFVIDFLHCTGMDSTFLGVLAGAAMQLRKATPPGGLTLVRVGPRNLELVRNLGLHRLLTVDSGEFPMSFQRQDAALACSDRSELDNARVCLEAHENLVAADEGNRAKFQDVLVFLRNRVEQR